MSEMNCEQYRTEIEESDFTAGRLTARSEAHAATCAVCRDFGDERAALRGLVAGLARVDAPPDFEFRLRARMSAAGSAQTRSWPQNLLPRAAWLAAAGCLALAALIALQTRNSQTPGAQQTAAQPGANAVADAGAASREVPGETADSAHAAESATLTAELNEASVKQRRARAASFAAANVARPSQRRPAAAQQPAGEAVALSGERVARTETSTSSMTGAPVIVSTAIPLPVSADERPLQVLFKDTQGASRLVNVAPVSFGSNEPAARPANAAFKKAAKKQGVW